MKKFYTLLFACILGCLCVSAQKTVKLYCETEGVTFEDNTTGYREKKTLPAGEAVDFVIPQWSTARIYAPDDKLIVRVTCDTEGSWCPTDVGKSTVNFYNSGSSWYPYVEGAIYTVVLGEYEDTRTSSVTVRVDHPERLQIGRGGSNANQIIIPEEAESVIKYNPTDEKTFYFDRSGLQGRVYAVKRNGEDMPINSYNLRYYFSVTNGDVVDVVTEWPQEETRDVIFNVSEGYEDFLRVKVNDEEVDWRGRTVTVGEGDEAKEVYAISVYDDAVIEVFGDLENYELKSSKLDGNNLVFIPSSDGSSGTDGHTSMYVYGNHTYDFNVRPYLPWTITVNVDNPENVVVYNASSPNEDAIIELESGANVIAYKEQHPEFLVVPANSDCYILSVKANMGSTNPDAFYEKGIETFNVYDEMVINITTAVVERNDSFRLYIDPETAEYTVTNAAGTELDVKQGWNTVEYARADLPITVSFKAPVTEEPEETEDPNMGEPDPASAEDEGTEEEEEETEPQFFEGYVATQNGTSLNQTWEYSGVFQINTVSDGDVVKFYASEPGMCSVRVIAGGEISTNDFSIVSFGEPVELDENGSVTVERGTRLTFTDLSKDIMYYMYSGPFMIQADENGDFNFDVLTDNTMIIFQGMVQRLYFTLNIDNPEAVTITGVDYDKEDTLVKGENELIAFVANPVISIEANEGYVLLSLTDGENELVDNAGALEVSDNAVYTLRTDAIEANMHATVMLAGEAKATLSNYMENETAFEAGYNDVDFSRYHNPHTLVLAEEGYVFVNDQEETPTWEGPCTYELVFRHNDIVKIYKGERPEFCGLSFEVLGNPEYVTVTRDLTVNEANWLNGLSVLEGTSVVMEAAEGHSIKVSLEGNVLDTPMENVYDLTANGNAHYVVTVDNYSGLEAIFGTDAAVGQDVYNLQGILLMRNATSAELRQLPGGIYIAGGRKVLVK